MRNVFGAVFSLIFAMFSLPDIADAHGGGCRKNSPPGQCCHMDKKKGQVHCH